MTEDKKESEKPVDIPKQEENESFLEYMRRLNQLGHKPRIVKIEFPD